MYIKGYFVPDASKYTAYFGHMWPRNIHTLIWDHIIYYVLVYRCRAATNLLAVAINEHTRV